MNLIEVLYVFVFIILSEIVYTKCFGICINKKMNLKIDGILTIILIAVFDMINFYYNKTNIYRFLISYFLTITLNKRIFKSNLKTSIFYTTLIFLFAIIMEFIVIQGLKVISINSIEILNLNLQCQALYSILILYLTLIIFVFYKKHFNRKILNEYILKNNYLNFILFVLFFLVFLMLIIYSIDYTRMDIFIISIISCCIIFIFIVTILYNAIKESKLLERYNFLLERNSYFEHVREDYRILKHNLINDLLSVKVIGDNKVKELIKEKIKKYNKEYEWITNIDEIPNNLQGLIQLKLLIAKKLDIVCHIETTLKTDYLDNLDMSVYDNLSDAISITLDNALEAAKDCKEKFVYICIEEEKNQLIIRISNPFINDIDLECLGTKDYSTKKRNSGIGIFSLYKLINKNKIIIKSEIINDLFTTIIVTQK